MPDAEAIDPAGETRVSHVVARMRKLVGDGAWRPGLKLPTQDQLAAEFRISRSVLREAVAMLKAEGLLTSRRGSGVYVAKSPPPFVRLSGEDLDQMPGILHLLELRAAIEIEAAGHAALRRSERQARAISAALALMDAEIEASENAIQADLEFHLAIAEASNNPRFSEVLGHLRELLIPRQRVRLRTDPALGHAGYLRMLQREHREIEAAIRVGDAVEARAAMRRHLVDGALRYRRWAEDGSVGSRAAVTRVEPMNSHHREAIG